MELRQREGCGLCDQQKVAFITDVDSPSGQAAARKLAAQGYALALHTKSSRPAILTGQTGGISPDVPILWLPEALDNQLAVTHAVTEMIEAFGQIDVLVHIQDLVVRESIATCSVDQFQTVMDSHVKSAFLCTQAVGARMITRESGAIIYVSSIHDEKPTGSAFLYSTAKGAIKMLSREAALTLGRYHIRANVIEWGPVQGDDVRFASPLTDLYEHYATKVPAARLGTADDLADVIAFLASTQAGYVNGAEIRVDGGFLLHYMDHKMRQSGV